MLIVVLSIIVLIVLIGVLFVNLSPQFGGSGSKEMKAGYENSAQYRNGIFVNEKEVDMSFSAGDIFKIMRKFIFPEPNSRPGFDLPVLKVDSAEVATYQQPTRLIWFGHSTFLLQMDGKNILIDPMFGSVPAPHPWLGQKRFHSEFPIEIQQLPRIDAVFYSHDHYDHLDYPSLKKLMYKVKRFYAPLGVGAHLRTWGVPDHQINEMDWWESGSFEGLSLHCTPAQHFSGRGLSDRSKTLWCSWVIGSDQERIFFSGDSGYSPHFKEIGDRYGPFDIALMECGQYNELWSDIHMMPEETAQAGIDVGAKTIVPIHWGAFKLALHTWTDPVERVSQAADDLGINLCTPKIGEPIILGNDLPESKWWQKEY